MAGSMDKVTAAIDKLVTAVKNEIDRTAKRLTDSTATTSDSAGTADSDAAIQSAIDRLNNLSAQLDAVEPDAIAAGDTTSVAPLETGDSTQGSSAAG